MPRRHLVPRCPGFCPHNSHSNEDWHWYLRIALRVGVTSSIRPWDSSEGLPGPESGNAGDSRRGRRVPTLSGGCKRKREEPEGVPKAKGRAETDSDSDSGANKFSRRQDFERSRFTIRCLLAQRSGRVTIHCNCLLSARDLEDYQSPSLPVRCTQFLPAEAEAEAEGKGRAVYPSNVTVYAELTEGVLPSKFCTLTETRVGRRSSESMIPQTIKLDVARASPLSEYQYYGASTESRNTVPVPRRKYLKLSNERPTKQPAYRRFNNGFSRNTYGTVNFNGERSEYSKVRGPLDGHNLPSEVPEIPKYLETLKIPAPHPKDQRGIFLLLASPATRHYTSHYALESEFRSVALPPRTLIWQ
ncbi:hypothetical protein C8R43DRAFT_1109200 [Mycena crocata]|nr:hypothetical protein C8R43DRAFT_1109200 [Mycena crocata]